VEKSLLYQQLQVVFSSRNAGEEISPFHIFLETFVYGPLSELYVLRNPELRNVHFAWSFFICALKLTMANANVSRFCRPTSVAIVKHDKNIASIYLPHARIPAILPRGRRSIVVDPDGV
jgi:hypothetical protein